jgi:hypothetical protein
VRAFPAQNVRSQILMIFHRSNRAVSIYRSKRHFEFPHSALQIEKPATIITGKVTAMFALPTTQCWTSVLRIATLTTTANAMAIFTAVDFCFFVCSMLFSFGVFLFLA